MSSKSFNLNATVFSEDVPGLDHLRRISSGVFSISQRTSLHVSSSPQKFTLVRWMSPRLGRLTSRAVILKSAKIP